MEGAAAAPDVPARQRSAGRFQRTAFASSWLLLPATLLVAIVLALVSADRVLGAPHSDVELLGWFLSATGVISLLVGAGVANLTSQSTAQTLVQLLAPPEKRGRIVGVYTMASNGLRAGSGLSIGLVGGMIGIHWSLGLSALTLAVLVLGLLWYAARRAAAAARVGVTAQRFA